MSPLPFSVTLAGFGAPIDGSEVLLMEPNAVLSKPQAQLMRGARVDATSGAGFADKATHQLPGARHEFQFVCATREELNALRNFFDSMEGRKTGFWFPTWQWELEIGMTSWGASIPSIKTSARFGDRYFGESLGYRLWATLRGERAEIYQAAAINPAGTATPPEGYEWIENGVTQLVNGGLAADGVAAPFTEAKGVRPLWLRFGRFESDVFDAEVNINGEGAAVVTLAIVEAFDFPVTMTGDPAVMEWHVNDGLVEAPDTWIIHTFDNPNTPPAGFSGLYVDPHVDAFVVSSGSGDVEVLLVPGGGGGASVNGSGVSGGGGGGGGVKEFREGDAKAVSVGSYPLLIGAGGREGIGTTGAITGNNGSDTTGFGETAPGGGGGGGKDLSLGFANQRDGRAGGCGGGGGAADVTVGAGGVGSPGGDGGPGAFFSFAGGGGGADPLVGDGALATGGIGLLSDISGTPTYYGGGGAGPRNFVWGGGNGTPGLGGGGANRLPGTDGLGGGGGGSDGNGHGGRGGNGRAIVRYLASSGIVATGGVVTVIPA